VQQMFFCKSLVFWLSTITCFCSLWTMFCLNVWFYTCANSNCLPFLKNIIFNKYYLTFCRKLNKIIFCQHWKIAFLQHVLTYDVKGGANIFFIIINFLELIGSLNKSLLIWLSQ
jgi:hypothetical protein